MEKIIQAYFTDRIIIAENDKRYKLITGIPQGSTLGPTVWNTSFLQLEIPENVQLSGFADDLTMVVVDKSTTEIVNKNNESITMLREKMRELKLELA